MAALAATLLFRLWFSAALPVTADEAYFILWGRSPALGYYDHPPMVGWLLAPLAALGDAPWLLRLPAVLLAPLAALMLRAALHRWFGADEDTADLAALALLLVPANVWNVLITTDTPLVLFSTTALLVFARAAKEDSGRMFFAAGVLLGLAFLSKYFAVLLGLAFLVWAVLARKPRAFLLVFLGGLPFGLLNLYWNYEACWCNVMFNAINRHEGDGSGWSLATPGLYALSLAYLAAPLLWFAWRGRGRLREAWGRPGERARAAARLGGAAGGIRRPEPGQAHRPALAAVVSPGAGGHGGARLQPGGTDRERALVRAARRAARDPYRRGRGTATGYLEVGAAVVEDLSAAGVSRPHRRTDRRRRAGSRR